METTSPATNAVLEVLFGEISSNKAAISGLQDQVAALYQQLVQRELLYGSCSARCQE